MNLTKKIAVVCNYSLNANRIGGMDRFYVAYDQKAKELGYVVDWFFIAYEPFDFFKDLTIYAGNSNVEQLFLDTVKNEHKQYDILVTHFTALCTPFYKQVKKMGVDNIIAVDHNPRPLQGFPLKKRLKNKLKGLFYARYINQFIGVSSYTKQHILNDYGIFLDSKTSVIYNGIETSVFKKRTKINEHKFIVTSHLRASKGIQDLIVAVSQLEPSLQQLIKLDIYGEGPYESTLKQLTINLKLEEIIHFKGSSSQLNTLFCNYSYMIQPTYMECFSLSILESLASNVPVITTTVGGNLEVVTDNINGFIFEPGDIEALTELLKNIVLKKLKITNDTSSLIESEFNLEKMVENHIQLLK